MPAGSQAGRKLSPQALFEQGALEKAGRWQQTTPASAQDPSTESDLTDVMLLFDDISFQTCFSTVMISF